MIHTLLSSMMNEISSYSTNQVMKLVQGKGINFDGMQILVKFSI